MHLCAILPEHLIRNIPANKWAALIQVTFLLSPCSHLNITFIPAHICKWLSNVFLGRFSLVLQSHKMFVWPEQFNLPIWNLPITLGFIESMTPFALICAMVYVNAEVIGLFIRLRLQHFDQCWHSQDKNNCTVQFNNVVSFLLHLCILQETFSIFRYYIAYSKTELMVFALLVPCFNVWATEIPCASYCNSILFYTYECATP